MTLNYQSIIFYSETGKTIIDGLHQTSDGCDYLWTDTVLGDVTIFRSLLRFQEYDGSYDIACEVETGNSDYVLSQNFAQRIVMNNDSKIIPWTNGSLK